MPAIGTTATLKRIIIWFDVKCDISDVERKVEMQNGCKIESSNLVFEGVCKNCNQGSKAAM